MMYYALILFSVSLAIVLTYSCFRFVEGKIQHQLSSQFLAIFYGYASIVYALVAILVSWMWLYYLNVFKGIPFLITAYLCASHSTILSQSERIRRVVTGLICIALAIALVGLILFLNR